MILNLFIEANYKLVQLLAQFIIHKKFILILLILVPFLVLINFHHCILESDLSPMSILFFLLSGHQNRDLLVLLRVDGPKGPEFLEVHDARDEKDDDVLLGVADTTEEEVILEDADQFLGDVAPQLQEVVQVGVLQALSCRVYVCELHEIHQLVERKIEGLYILLMSLWVNEYAQLLRVLPDLSFGVPPAIFKVFPDLIIRNPQVRPSKLFVVEQPMAEEKVAVHTYRLLQLLQLSLLFIHQTGAVCSELNVHLLMAEVGII